MFVYAGNARFFPSRIYSSANDRAVTYRHVVMVRLGGNFTFPVSDCA